MAKVIAPFKIVGTLDDLNFYIDENNTNRVRTKGKTGVSSEEFLSNPIFTKVKNHGKEFGKAVKKAQSFRAIAHYFYNKAKDGSFAGRANKLLLEIIKEDTINPEGERTFENGMLQPETKTYFLNFEGNKLRPLNEVLKANWHWDENEATLRFEQLIPSKHIDWPETAEQAHLAIALANWNYFENTFTTEYSEEIILKKDDTSVENSILKTKTPTDNQLHILFLYIGFSKNNRRKSIDLKRSYNTVTIIWTK